jgi:hypothetical protein
VAPPSADLAGSSVVIELVAQPILEPHTRLQKRYTKFETDGTIRYGLLTTTGELHNIEEALANTNRCKSMEEEYGALMQNKT